MVNVEHLKQIYADKLIATGSLDEAFVKAVWVAYKQGLTDAAPPLSTTEGIKIMKLKLPKFTITWIVAIILLATCIWAITNETQAATATTWSKQNVLLNLYKAGTVNKYLPVDQPVNTIPASYKKQPGTYYQCISNNNAKKYIAPDVDCYGKKLDALVYCPVKFCINRENGSSMAIFTNSETYQYCDRLYFEKEKLVSVFDSTKEILNTCNPN